jgi:hypothetical protein
MDLFESRGVSVISKPRLPTLGISRAELVNPCSSVTSESSAALLQDYNREVLTSLTMPNYEANVGGVGGVPRFFSGGWASLIGLLREEGLAGSYDFLFTTDSIYSLDSQQHLLDCIADVGLAETPLPSSGCTELRNLTRPKF